MAATKSLSTSIAAATSNSAGGTTTGTAIDLTTSYGAYVTTKVTNGATGPTVAATVYIETSGDNSNWKTHAAFLTATGNNTVTEPPPVYLPPPVMYCRVRVTGNTGQAVTCEAFVHRLTAI